MNPTVEYLTAMLYAKDYEKNHIPVIKNKAALTTDPFWLEYKKYKEHSFLTCAVSDPKEIASVPAKEINKKIRILRHYFSTTDQLKTSFCRDYTAKQHTYHLPGDGPLMYFFCSHQLGWRELIVPKRFLYNILEKKQGRIICGS